MRDADLLSAHALPSVELLAQIIEIRDPERAAELRATTDPVVRVLGVADSGHQMTGWASTTSSEVIVVTVEWTWQSWRRGPVPDGCTVIQAVVGGLSGGEGSVGVEQWVIDRVVSESAAAAAALLIAGGVVPRFARGGEA